MGQTFVIGELSRAKALCPVSVWYLHIYLRFCQIFQAKPWLYSVRNVGIYVDWLVCMTQDQPEAFYVGNVRKVREIGQLIWKNCRIVWRYRYKREVFCARAVCNCDVTLGKMLAQKVTSWNQEVHAKTICKANFEPYVVSYNIKIWKIFISSVWDWEFHLLRSVILNLKK